MTTVSETESVTVKLRRRLIAVPSAGQLRVAVTLDGGRWSLRLRRRADAPAPAAGPTTQRLILEDTYNAVRERARCGLACQLLRASLIVYGSWTSRGPADSRRAHRRTPHQSRTAVPPARARHHTATLPAGLARSAAGPVPSISGP